MNELNLYLLSHPVPFPSSEYGGVHIVAAYNEKEAYELVIDNLGSWEKNKAVPFAETGIEIIGLSIENSPKHIQSFIT